MATPIVIATNGFGIPVTESDFGAPVEIAANGFGTPVVVVASGGTPVKGAYSAEANALFARFTTPPTDARKVLINNLITTLKASGVWAKLDALYVMAAADTQAAQRNWIADLYNLSLVSAPTFTTDRGYAGNGTTSYLSTGWMPTNGVNYTQNSASFGVWIRTNVQNNGSDMAAGNGDNRIDTYSFANQAVARINDNTNLLPASASSIGFWVAKRTGASAKQFRKNNAELANAATASVARVASTMTILSDGAAVFQTRQASAAFMGGGLSDTESDALYTALQTYMTAVGA